MRLESKILFFSHIFLMMYMIYFFRDLLLMMVNPLDNEADLILDKDINKNIPVDKQMIPKLIHQTYKTDEIPEHWVKAQKQCIDLHYPDYNYTLWTDTMIDTFIEQKYPWFLDTYKAYEHNIQRADAMRYFVLREYGGVYIDLDDACERKLDPLLQYTAFFRKTSPLGVSNDVMGTIPEHPLFVMLTENLERFSKVNIFNVPYLSIMFSTGPMFVSIVHQRWLRKAWSYGLGLNKDAQKILDQFRPKVMQPYQYKNSIGSFFKIAEGSSWHTDDSNIMFILGAHITACVVAGFILFFVVFFIELLLYVSLQNVINSNKNKDTSLLLNKTDDYTNSPFTFRIPFKLTLTRFLNKIKGISSSGYTRVSDNYLPTHSQSSSNSSEAIPMDQICNNNSKYNYQRHQMRRQSNLPAQIQSQLDVNAPNYEDLRNDTDAQ
ncbi:hypothetical protein QEN19_001942 [Hanseniaspora menglaensis]